MQKPITVVTYNVHSCVNIFGREQPETIARVIAAVDPDVVCLQEVTVSGPGKAGDACNQAEWIAARLNMHYAYFPLRAARWGDFGLALLSRYPPAKVRNAVLSNGGGHPQREARGAMWYRFDTPIGLLNIINTHLALYRDDRRHQAQKLLDREWLGGLSGDEPVIFCGDLNAGTGSPVYRGLASRYADVQAQVGRRGYPRCTFHSLYPMLRLDHIFISRHLTVRDVKVPFNLEARVASDHLPVTVKLDRRAG